VDSDPASLNGGARASTNLARSGQRKEDGHTRPAGNECASTRSLAPGADRCKIPPPVTRAFGSTGPVLSCVWWLGVHLRSSPGEGLPPAASADSLRAFALRASAAQVRDGSLPSRSSTEVDGRLSGGPPSQRSGQTPSSRCFGGTAFARTGWRSLAEAQRGKRWKPELSEGWCGREDSVLTAFFRSGLFEQFRERRHPTKTRIPLNTRSKPPNQPQQDIEFSGRHVDRPGFAIGGDG